MTKRSPRTDRRRRWTCDGHPEVWAIEGCATIPSPSGRAHPTLAQHALREARVLAQNIFAVLDGRPASPMFIYHILGMMGSLGYQQGIRTAHQGSRARPRRMVRPAHLLPAPDARLVAATADHADRLGQLPGAVPAECSEIVKSASTWGAKNTQLLQEQSQDIEEPDGRDAAESIRPARRSHPLKANRTMKGATMTPHEAHLWAVAIDDPGPR